MVANAELAKLCIHVDTQCAEYSADAGVTWTRGWMVLLANVEGALIPLGSTAWPAPSDLLGIGANFIASYVTDFAGVPLSPQPVAVDVRSCHAATVDCVTCGPGTPPAPIAPIITAPLAGADFPVPENLGGLVTTPAATGTAPIVWTLGGVDAALFTINPSAGAITWVTAPDFETPLDAGADNVYNVTLTATNAAGAASTAITVSVTDVAELVPPVIIGPANGSTITQPENQGGVAVTPASFDAGIWTLGGPDAALFTINPVTGVVSWVAAPDFETPLDAGANNAYDITITLTNAGGADSASVTIAVTDVAEIAPTVVGLTPTVSGPIGAPVSTTFTVTGAPTTVTADNGATITGPVVGVYTLTYTPAAAGPTTITVTATNAFGSGTGATTVTGTAPVAPTITAPAAAANVTMPENTLTSVNLFAPAATGTAPISWTLAGPDAAAFTINAGTGVVRFAASPDFEVPTDAGANNVYNVDIVATNVAGSATVSVTVTVTDVAAPSITDPSPIAATEGASITVPVTITGNPATAIATLGTLAFVSGTTWNWTFTPGAGTGGTAITPTITATNPEGTDTQVVTVNVAAVSDHFFAAPSGTHLYSLSGIWGRQIDDFSNPFGQLNIVSQNGSDSFIDQFVFVNPPVTPWPGVGFDAYLDNATYPTTVPASRWSLAWGSHTTNVVTLVTAAPSGAEVWDSRLNVGAPVANRIYFSTGNTKTYVFSGGSMVELTNGYGWGSGAPLAGEGVDGAFYYDTVGNQFFAKVAGAWVSA